MKKLVLLFAIGIALFSCNGEKEKREKKAHDLICTSVDGIVYGTPELKNAWNQSLITNLETANNLEVVMGRMKKVDADLKLLEFKTKIKVSDVEKETAAKILMVN